MFDRIVRLSLDNSVFVNLLFILIILAGGVSAWMLPREEFPEISLDRVAVNTIYLGATAEDVEELITRPLEEGLEDVADVDKVVSTSQEGRSSIVVTFTQGVDIGTARSEVEKAVSTVDDLPDDSETPIVKEVKFEIPVVAVALIGDPSATRLTDEVTDKLRKIDGVSTVKVTGVAHPTIFVDLDERQLRALSIQPATVAAAIRNAHANVPAGTVEVDGQDIFVKTEKSLRSAADVARTPLFPGSQLRIGDIADVKAVADPSDTLIWVDDRRAVKLLVGREKGADPMRILVKVREQVEALAPTIPPGLELVMAENFTATIEDRLKVVGWNALGGGALVILVLYIMSGGRQALLAVWGMPISFLMATFLMYLLGLTINVVSTFGLLVAIGIIVDDAIVVIENVQRHMEMGKERRQAVIDGTKEVLLPVSVAVTTTCLAFVPLTMVSGTMGRIMQILPAVVIFCLIGSMIEAIFILPGHLGHYAKVGDQDGRTARLSKFMKRIYRPPLRWCVAHPIVTIASVVMGFLATVVLSTTMPFQVNAPAKPFDLSIYYEIMPGLDRAETRKQGEAIDDIVERHLGDNIATTSLQVGSYFNQDSGRSYNGANLGKVFWQFNLDDAAIATYPGMVRELRKYLATNPDLGSHRVAERTAGPPSGAPITANVRGREVKEINAAVAALKSELYTMEGVSDIRDDYGAGKETFSVRVDQDRASRQGLTERDVAQAVRTTVDGITAIEVSINEEQVDIVVRYAGGQSRSKHRLHDTLLATPQGGFVRLDQVAEIDRVREVGLIGREDGMRTVAVRADIDVEVTSPLEAAADVEQLWDDKLAERFPGISLSFGGEADELIKSLNDLPALFGFAIFMIYLVLALQFRSYLQPVIILAAVPFGLMGAVLGLAGMGLELSIFAMFGMVALVGIVVNDSLVMIDFINKRRAEGLSISDAAIDGALQRLRPIISTTLTTCLGLLPMAIGFGGRDNVLAPMAISIAAGLFVATALVLLAIPPLYVLIERIRT